MAEQDFYDVLGVARDADEGAIKKAYRKLAMKYHPDRNAGDGAAEVRFREVNEAYEVLKDTQKRAAYDRFGHAAFDGSMGAGQAHDFASSFADVFDDLFGNFGGGGRRRRGGGMQGADLRHDMEITLEEAFSGKKADIRVSDQRHLRSLRRQRRARPRCDHVLQHVFGLRQGAHPAGLLLD